MNHADLRYDGAAERRARILAALKRLGFQSITELARYLRVSPMTVRRDLHILEASGDVRLVHGGARVLTSAAFPSDGMGPARDRMAAIAAALVGPTDTIAVDAGPAAYALARALTDSFRGSVITHSIPVLQLLAGQTCGARLVALGGELRVDRLAFIGPATEAALGGLRARSFFLEPAAVDTRGIYASSPAEASVQRGLMEIADEVVLLAASDVAEKSAPALIAPLERVTRLVTNAPVPPRLEMALRRAGVALHGNHSRSIRGGSSQ